MRICFFDTYLTVEELTKFCLASYHKFTNTLGIYLSVSKNVLIRLVKKGCDVIIIPLNKFLLK